MLSSGNQNLSEPGDDFPAAEHAICEPSHFSCEPSAPKAAGYFDSMKAKQRAIGCSKYNAIQSGKGRFNGRFLSAEPL